METETVTIYDWILFIGSIFTILITLIYLFLTWKKRLYSASMVALLGAVNLLVSGIAKVLKGEELEEILFTGFIMLIWLATYAMTAWRYRKNLE